MNALARLFRTLVTPTKCECCKTCMLGHECSCDACDVAIYD